jgi:hypothetical protein
MLSDVKMEMMNHYATGNRNSITWFDKNIKPTLENKTLTPTN